MIVSLRRMSGGASWPSDLNETHPDFPLFPAVTGDDVSSLDDIYVKEVSVPWLHFASSPPTGLSCANCHTNSLHVYARGPREAAQARMSAAEYDATAECVSSGSAATAMGGSQAPRW